MSESHEKNLIHLNTICRICKNAIMASIGKDDLFDEETVRLYLKEVTQWTQLIMFVSQTKKSKKISKARETGCVSVLGKIDIGKLR